MAFGVKRERGFNQGVRIGRENECRGKKGEWGACERLDPGRCVFVLERTKNVPPSKTQVRLLAPNCGLRNFRLKVLRKCLSPLKWPPPELFGEFGGGAIIGVLG